MKQHVPVPLRPSVHEDDAARVLMRLRSTLALVEQITDAPLHWPVPDEPIDVDRLDEAARFALGYAGMSSIARRRFDAIGAEAAAFSASGLSALIRHRSRTGRDCPAAAAQLAREIRQSLARLTELVAA